jgi:hypothetical protein
VCAAARYVSISDPYLDRALEAPKITVMTFPALDRAPLKDCKMEKKKKTSQMSFNQAVVKHAKMCIHALTHLDG